VKDIIQPPTEKIAIRKTSKRRKKSGMKSKCQNEGNERTTAENDAKGKGKKSDANTKSKNKRTTNGGKKTKDANEARRLQNVSPFHVIMAEGTKGNRKRTLWTCQNRSKFSCENFWQVIWSNRRLSSEDQNYHKELKSQKCYEFKGPSRRPTF
jgi:hypothetical protein